MHKTNIDLQVKDSTIWNRDEVLYRLSKKPTGDIILSMGVEGPCMKSSGVDELIYRSMDFFNLDKEQFIIVNGNHLKSSSFNEKFTKNTLSLYNWYSEQTNNTQEIEWDRQKIFGIFIGRSNWLRLDIASYLYANHYEDSVVIYHFDHSNEWHSENFELEQFVLKNYNNKSIDQICLFLKNLPITNAPSAIYPIQYSQASSLENDYQKIFIEIVCETFFTGKTFHMSEKILRPILYKRPFIVQASKFFLKNLHALGFKTFNHWWDESYDIDPWDYKPTAIKNNIDYIVSQDQQTLQKWYKEMKPILDHNYNVLQLLRHKNWDEINLMLNKNYNELDFGDI